MKYMVIIMKYFMDNYDSCSLRFSSNDIKKEVIVKNTINVWQHMPNRVLDMYVNFWQEKKFKK